MDKGKKRKASGVLRMMHSLRVNPQQPCSNLGCRSFSSITQKHPPALQSLVAPWETFMGAADALKSRAHPSYCERGRDRAGRTELGRKAWLSLARRSG